MTNIYKIVISCSDEDDETLWTEAESPLEAISVIYQDAQDDLPEGIMTSKEVTVKVSIEKENMTMLDFEGNYPDFFFT